MRILFVLPLLAFASMCPAAKESAENIQATQPPEDGFYLKRLDFEGIPIKAHVDVSDEALAAAKARLAMMLDKLPGVRRRLRDAGAELHIIGKKSGHLRPAGAPPSQRQAIRQDPNRG